MTSTSIDGSDGSTEYLARQLEEVAANVGSVLFGKREVVRLALACMAAGGHLLIEDLPGVGKTTLAKALSQTLGLHCRRVQFTADLLPSDLIGAMVFDRERSAPVFHPGPVFTNILLADELNRASPKAQSALLEAMEEGQVSVDGVTHPLPKPFMVIATQNPYDSSGTYPLPFSQRDRFLLRTSIGYPGRQAEDRLLATSGERPRPEELRVIGGAQMLADLADAVDTMYVAAEVRAYVLDIVEATRHHPSLVFGASPRAGLALLRTASAFAVTAGRDYMTPDDVKAVAGVVLAHRLAVSSAAELGGYSSTSLIAELLATVPVPVRAPNHAATSA
ncbi:MAG TPA: MoxR family ATPase [Acidimicrobiales bacterium]|jgi:MoxR-like ATPase|nr:MoxR family ATPase [Acidimicrobiales bacterium]